MFEVSFLVRRAGALALVALTFDCARAANNRAWHATREAVSPVRVWGVK